MAYYFPRTIQNVTTALLKNFTGFVVKKYDVNGNEVGEYNVPIMWGPIDKHRDIRKENYNETQDRYYLTFPRMALSGPTLAYNADRCVDANGIRQHYSKSLGLNNIDDFYSDPVPAPYDYTYTLYIKSQSMDHMNQILENILPYFNPDIFLRVKEFSFLNIERDLKVTMTGGISPNFDPFEQTEENRRFIEVQLEFTVEGFMYLPISTTKIIKFIDSQYFIKSDTIENSIMIDQYITSGFEGTSAFEAPNDVPTSGFNFSGYNDSDNVYYYTSATTEALY